MNHPVNTRTTCITNPVTRNKRRAKAKKESNKTGIMDRESKQKVKENKECLPDCFYKVKCAAATINRHNPSRKDANKESG
jgi:hypothetical protein